MHAGEEFALEAAVDAQLVGELPVEVDDGVERHVGIADVVRQHGREEDHVVVGPPGRVPPLHLLEGLEQSVVDVRRAPRQLPVHPHLLLAVHADGFVVVTRQRVEGIAPVGIEVEEVTRRFVVEADVSPQVGIDGVLDEHHAVRLEERAQFRRQQRDGVFCDELVGLEAPCPHPSRQQHQHSNDGEDERQARHETHDCIRARALQCPQCLICLQTRLNG